MLRTRRSWYAVCVSFMSLHAPVGERTRGSSILTHVNPDVGQTHLVSPRLLNEFDRGSCDHFGAVAHHKMRGLHQPLLAGSHRGTASVATCARRPRTAPAVSTSTSRPSSSSRSSCNAAMSNNVRPGSRSTSKSMSESARAFPLAVEPKTRGREAPWRTQSAVADFQTWRGA